MHIVPGELRHSTMKLIRLKQTLLISTRTWKEIFTTWVLGGEWWWCGRVIWMICKLPHEREWPTDNHRAPPFKHLMSFFTPGKIITGSSAFQMSDFGLTRLRGLSAAFLQVEKWESLVPAKRVKLRAAILSTAQLIKPRHISTFYRGSTQDEVYVGCHL